MARVVAADVQAILETTLAEAVITPYITSANAMVDEVMGTEETSDILKEIERWLAAHMIVITKKRQAIKEEAGGAAITYTGKYGLGLESTSYGQMVLSLDTSGAFASLSLKSVHFHTFPQESDTDD